MYVFIILMGMEKWFVTLKWQYESNIAELVTSFIDSFLNQ